MSSDGQQDGAVKMEEEGGAPGAPGAPDAAAAAAPAAAAGAPKMKKKKPNRLLVEEVPRLFTVFETSMKVEKDTARRARA